MLDDKSIIDLFHERDEKAISETEQKYGKLCYKVSLNILHNEQDAEESVSDTLLKLWNSIPPEYPICLKNFILKIIRNLSLNKYKMKHSAKRGHGEYEVVLDEIKDTLPDTVNTNDILIDSIHLRDTLNNFLNNLSTEKRSIFIGRYWYFESISEISKNLGLSTSKVKVVLFRCRVELKQLLLKEGFIV
ncbi:RNA polymerase sigma factor [uncultured Methanobrevibacter sp.]|uniref:RNA polymerase sigma factor n=1 Tax=uncultured Methanobrevibacter sp. TaxID=253161 RepID=UPI0025DE9729|nr:RNA polymerase sigma factor [uncultured Methanobrevibacter sp.]